MTFNLVEISGTTSVFASHGPSQGHCLINSPAGTELTIQTVVSAKIREQTADVITPRVLSPAINDPSLKEIQQQLNSRTWPSALQNHVDQINHQIDLFTDPTQRGGTPQNNLPSLQVFVRLHVKELFESWIYKTPGIVPQDVTDLLHILQLDTYAPPVNFPGRDEVPPPVAGMIPYLLKNLKETDDIVLQGGNPPDTRYHATQLPTVGGVRYVNIPFGYSGGRLCISNGKNADDFHTWPFLEFTVTPDGQIVTNFTAVDTVATLPLTLQRVGDNEWNGVHDPNMDSRAVGFKQDFAAISAKMQAFYQQWDTTPGQRWLHNMFNPNGSIKSGKYMNDPVITAALGNYVAKIVACYNESNPMYFIGDGTAGVCSGYFARQDNQLVFIGKNPQDPRTFTQKMPSLTDPACTMNAWISGGEGFWNISPITHDPSGKDTTDWNMRNFNWGVAKALTALINTGIPFDCIGTKDLPMGGGNWSTPESIANYFKAEFYNLYARAAQCSGCNAYVVDFGDVLGADGTLFGKPGDHDCIIVSLYYERQKVGYSGNHMLPSTRLSTPSADTGGTSPFSTAT